MSNILKRFRRKTNTSTIGSTTHDDIVGSVPVAKNENITGATKEQVDRLYLLMVGVIVVLLVGFVASLIAVGGLVVNYEAEKQTTYQNLRDQVQSQSAEIEVLTNQLKNSTVTPK